MNREPTVVVGAGIAGLCVALALSRRGRPVEIFERARELRPVGAGIQLSPNALRVLARLDLLEAIAARSIAAQTVTLRDARSGKTLAAVPVSSADGTGYLTIHRGDLQAVLLDAVLREPAVRLHRGMELVAAAHDDAGCALAFQDGASGARLERRVVLTIAADGVRSAVAAALGLPPARDSGLVAARFMGTAGPGGRLEGIEAWLGARSHAVAYPLRGAADVNLVLIGPAASTATEARGRVGGWDRRLNALLDRADFQGLWPLATSEPARRLVQGGFCLIGDAAHAMLPFAAQGAAMAIEDGFVLAEELAGPGGDGDGRAALSRFEAARRARLQAVRRRVRFHRLVYHLPRPLAPTRDLALRLHSPASLRADLGWLYDWAP